MRVYVDLEWCVCMCVCRIPAFSRREMAICSVSFKKKKMQSIGTDPNRIILLDVLASG